MIRAFPKGSSGGPDGLQPQHLKELCDFGEGSSEFLTALCNFLNILVNGICPIQITPLLFGGRLIALKKKTGGIRPIAIGCTYRRLIGKCLNAILCKSLLPYLEPLQVGVGCKGGAEAAVHAARLYLINMPQDYSFVKLDFKNAFNSISRTEMLIQAYNILPNAFKYIKLCYENPSALWFNGERINSSEGVQQGDPLGPLLFAITIQPLLRDINSDFKVAFLDDISLSDDTTNLSNICHEFIDKAEKIGLTLNERKSELISKRNHLPVNTNSFFKDFSLVPYNEASLLGAPLNKSRALDISLSKKRDELNSLTSKLHLLSSHDALTILRHSLSTPRIMYLLRCAPCVGNKLLEDIDSIFKSALSSCTNNTFNDLSWQQCILPVSLGGMGIRSVVDLACPAFLASFAGSFTLSRLILPTRFEYTDSDFSNICRDWCNMLNRPIPPAPYLQKSWDAPMCLDYSEQLFLSAANDSDKARLLACKAKLSYSWIHAWPLANMGLLMSDDEIRISVGLRLGCKITLAHTCICDAEVDCFGRHGLSCRKSSGRQTRHSMLNDAIFRSLSSINIPCIREPTGLPGLDGLRPDGCSLVPWKSGKHLVWDATVPDTFAPSHLPHTSTRVGSAAEKMATLKTNKYKGVFESHHFIPISIETTGPINLAGLHFLNTLGDRLNITNFSKLDKLFLFQRLSLIIQRGNAISVLGTSPRIHFGVEYE